MKRGEGREIAAGDSRKRRLRLVWTSSKLRTTKISAG